MGEIGLRVKTVFRVRMSRKGRTPIGKRTKRNPTKKGFGGGGRLNFQVPRWSEKCCGFGNDRGGRKIKKRPREGPTLGEGRYGVHEEKSWTVNSEEVRREKKEKLKKKKKRPTRSKKSATPR